MISDFEFLTEEGLIRLDEYCKSEGKKIILWGMGTTVEPILRTLKDLSVEFDFWGCGNSENEQTNEGKTILSYDDMDSHKEDVVLIGSFGYVPIIKRLRRIGVKRIFGLKEVYKYPLSEIRNDNLFLKSCFKNETFSNEAILIELYGNIGDVIARIGLVKYLLEYYGKDRVYLLFGERDNADIYQNITNNIYILDNSVVESKDKRLEILKALWQHCFIKSYILCDTKMISQRRVLNKYNSNIVETVYSDCLPEQEYLVGLDISTVKRELMIDNQTNLTAWGTLKVSMEENSICQITPERRYVVVNLGASKKTRQYPVEKFILVCDWIVSEGFDVVILGKGQHDEECADILLSCGEMSNHLVNLVSKLSISQCAKVMMGASAFVGTESALWNLSYALGIPSVVIYGGGDYGSFYHKDGVIEYASVAKMECFYCKWFCEKTDDMGVAECIYNIAPQLIIEKLRIVLHGEGRV